MIFPSNQDEYKKLTTMLEAGRKVDVIRLVREKHYCSLKEAKAWVEDFITCHFIPMAQVMGWKVPDNVKIKNQKIV